MLDPGANVGLGRFDQILQLSIWCIWYGSAFAGSHRHPEFRCLASHLRLFGDALVAAIGVDRMLIAVQEIGSRDRSCTLAAVLTI
jgi:hypothetical protein